MTNHDFLRSSTVYHDNSFMPFLNASVSIASAPVQYGLAVYTACNVIVSENNIVGFRMRDHYQRLVHSARILAMKDVVDVIRYEGFIQVIKQLLLDNKISDSVIVRITYYVDTVMAGTRIHDQPTGLSMFLLPLRDYFDKPSLDVCISSWQRVSDTSLPPRAKITGTYVNASLMKSEALMNGFDDCIALNANGHVAEGAVANVFAMKKGVLYTPAVTDDILEGITRDTIIKIAKAKGVEVIERTIDRSELYTADELFISGSSAKVWPITSVDRRPIGNRTIGPLTRAMQQWYKEVQEQRLIIEPSWYERMES